jgi:hypothetical protein
MTQTSAHHPLDNGDPGDSPRCPMEALADRFVDCPKPWFLRASAGRTPEGTCFVSLLADLDTPDQIEDLINYLARVRG